MTFEFALKVHFSTTLCWLWGKSPDLRQKVSIVKKYVFLESPFGSEEALWQSWRREEDISVEAKLCKVTSLADVQLNGAYSHCVPPFLSLRKSMVNVSKFNFGSLLSYSMILCPRIQFKGRHVLSIWRRVFWYQWGQFCRVLTRFSAGGCDHTWLCDLTV